MNFHQRYFSLKLTLAPFRLKSDFETVKTVAAIDALADRADMLYRGCVPGVKRDGSCYDCPPGTEPEPMLAKAEYYLKALQDGKYPLAGCFAEPGCTLIDHTFIQKDGALHIFYNRGYIGFDWAEKPHDTFGHAWTDDLVNWHYGQPAVSATDDYYQQNQIWAPAVLKHSDLYYMFYTGVNRYIAQSTCGAVSEDLYTWKQMDNNPIYTPGKWCPWDTEHWSNCRDVFVLSDDDGTFYMYFCTERYTDDGKTEPANGILQSYDLINWEEVCTFKMPSCNHMAESPFVIKKDGIYYFFYTACGIGTCYAVSDSPVGGWQEKGVLMGADKTPDDLAWVPSCAEVFCFKDRWYISCCTRQPGWEQYLEIFELVWSENGEVRVGKRIDAPIS